MTAERDWPVVESRLGAPLRVWGVLIPALCFLGIMILAVLLQANVVTDISGRMTLMVFGGFLLMVALAMISATIRNSLKSRPFPHADQSVLPDAPREPLRSPGQSSFSIITHQLEPTATGFRLAPIPNFAQRTAWFLSFWITVMLAIVVTMIWGLPLEFSTSVSLRIGLTGFTVLVTLAMIGLIHWMWDQAASGHTALIFDATSNTCLIDREKELITVPASDVAAIQLCAAWRRLDSNDGVTVLPAVELNLLWQEPSLERATESTTEQKWHRVTLMNSQEPAYHLIPIATKLADSLHVPLLNHATPEHWKLERQRSKTRPYETTGRSF